MRLIVAGGKRYALEHDEYLFLDELLRTEGITEVACSMTDGADLGGYLWAKSHRIGVRSFQAKKGRANRMAEYADILAIFPGDAESNVMLAAAKRHGLKIRRYEKV